MVFRAYYLGSFGIEDFEYSVSVVVGRRANCLDVYLGKAVAVMCHRMNQTQNALMNKRAR